MKNSNYLSALQELLLDSGFFSSKYRITSAITKFELEDDNGSTEFHAQITVTQIDNYKPDIIIHKNDWTAFDNSTTIMSKALKESFGDATLSGECELNVTITIKGIIDESNEMKITDADINASSINYVISTFTIGSYNFDQFKNNKLLAQKYANKAMEDGIDDVISIDKLIGSHTKVVNNHIFSRRDVEFLSIYPKVIAANIDDLSEIEATIKGVIGRDFVKKLDENSDGNELQASKVIDYLELSLDDLKVPITVLTNIPFSSIQSIRGKQLIQSSYIPQSNLLVARYTDLVIFVKSLVESSTYVKNDEFSELINESLSEMSKQINYLIEIEKVMYKTMNTLIAE